LPLYACKLNFSETSTIARNFQDEGFDRVDFEEVADMYVINTCSVTENADKQFKQVVKKAMKLNNKAFVAAGLLCAVKTGRISGS
jgi:threonylcarbamoyladenosine tRNA methylthiotransferase MtaB